MTWSVLLQKEGSLVVGVAEAMADVVVDTKIRGESLHHAAYCSYIVFKCRERSLSHWSERNITHIPHS